MTRHTMQCNTKPTRRQRTFLPRTEGLEGRQLLSTIAGDLDTSFHSTGYFITPLPVSGSSSSSNSGAWSVRIQPLDGKILAAGRSTPGDFGLIRMMPNGDLDSTFGSGGSVTTDFNGKTDVARDMALLPDGRILLAGGADTGTKTTANNDFALACYLPNGALDTTFGPDHTGKVATNLSTTTTGDTSNQYDFAKTMTVQADGKIVLGGHSNSPSGYIGSLARFNPDGSLDTSFGNGGKIFNPATGGIKAVLTQPDGKIVVTGSGRAADGRTGFYVARYDASGNLDPSFGQNGSLLTTVGATGNAGPGGMVLRSDGSIIATGYHTGTSDRDLVVIGYTGTGSLDSSFQGGIVEVARTGDQQGLGIVVQPDGKLVVCGNSIPQGTSYGDSLVARFLPNGTLDATFKGGGITTISASAYSDSFNSVALQSDGRIVTAGGATPIGAKPSNFSNPSAFYVARLLGDPAPLLASAVAPTPVHQSLTATQARPALTQALAYWRAHGEDTSRLGHLDLAIADLGGGRLGEASGSTITLDDNAAGWGWNMGRAAGRGRRASSGRMDLLSAVVHEVGHLLGHDHTEGGVMAEALAPDVRQVVADPGLSHASSRPAIEAFRVHGRRPRATARG